jgi:hypothetical protein
MERAATIGAPVPVARSAVFAHDARTGHARAAELRVAGTVTVDRPRQQTLGTGPTSDAVGRIADLTGIDTGRESRRRSERPGERHENERYSCEFPHGSPRKKTERGARDYTAEQPYVRRKAHVKVETPRFRNRGVA